VSEISLSSTFTGVRFYISITPPSFMKFCPVVPEICHGQVHVPKIERRKRIKRIIIIIIIIIRNGAKTISHTVCAKNFFNN
jgi:hypothetical protein